MHRKEFFYTYIVPTIVKVFDSAVSKIVNIKFKQDKYNGTNWYILDIFLTQRSKRQHSNSLNKALYHEKPFYF